MCAVFDFYLENVISQVTYCFQRPEGVVLGSTYGKFRQKIGSLKNSTSYYIFKVYLFT